MYVVLNYCTSPLNNLDSTLGVSKNPENTVQYLLNHGIAKHEDYLMKCINNMKKQEVSALMLKHNFSL